MDWQAEWIWDGGEASPRNAWRCFRRIVRARGRRAGTSAQTRDHRRFPLRSSGSTARLVGRGPVRSWPSAQMYDTYDVGHLLRRDEPNAIAVLVHHYGLSTFSYLRGRGGLLAQLDLRVGRRSRADDRDRRVLARLDAPRLRPARAAPLAAARLHRAVRCPALGRRLARCPRSTTATGTPAIPIGPVGTAPWTSVVPRDIPPLAEEAMRPVRIESLHRVEPVAWTTTIDVRSQLVPGAADHANHAVHAGYRRDDRARADGGQGGPRLPLGHGHRLRSVRRQWRARTNASSSAGSTAGTLSRRRAAGRRQLARLRRHRARPRQRLPRRDRHGASRSSWSRRSRRDRTTPPFISIGPFPADPVWAERRHLERRPDGRRAARRSRALRVRGHGASHARSGAARRSGPPDSARAGQPGPTSSRTASGSARGTERPVPAESPACWQRRTARRWRFRASTRATPSSSSTSAAS